MLDHTGLKNESGKKKSGKIERPAEAEKSHSKQAKSDKLIPNGVSAPEADGDEEAKSEGNDQTKQKSEPVQNDQVKFRSDPAHNCLESLALAEM